MDFRSVALALAAIPMIASFAWTHDAPDAASPNGALPPAATTAAATTDAGAAEPAPEAAVLLEQKTLKTMFKGLRFDEDWSGLKEGDTTTDHRWPDMKYVDLEDGWYASFGGQVRARYESAQNKNLQGGPVPHNNDFRLLRTRLHGDLHIADDARIFLELISAHVFGNDATPAANERNQLDVENLFIDLMGGPGMTLRLGRFEMAYGAQRLIGTGDWSNIRKQYNGVMVKLKDESWSTDIFHTHPTFNDTDHADNARHSRTLAGAYATKKIDPNSGADVYGLLFDEDMPLFTDGDGNATGQRRYTVGTRYWTKQDAMDYEAEVAAQTGDFGNDHIRAYMWAAKIGHTGDAECKPRFGLDLDYASGDSDPTDGAHETFNPVFASGHPYFGYLDLIGRQNIISVMPNVSFKVSETATFRASYSDFHLANENDSLYSESGAATLTDATGNSGNNVGKELDLTLNWTPPCMAPHGEVLLGYSVFKPDRFVEELGDGGDTNLLYLQYTFTF